MWCLSVSFVIREPEVSRTPPVMAIKPGKYVSSVLRRQRKWLMCNQPVSTAWQLVGGKQPLSLNQGHVSTFQHNLHLARWPPLAAPLTTLGLWVCKPQDRKWQRAYLEVVKKTLFRKRKDLVDLALNRNSVVFWMFFKWRHDSLPRSAGHTEKYQKNHHVPFSRALNIL